jgi:hypothetical protein
LDARALIEDLVQKIAPNTTIVGITEDPENYRVTVTGTSGVVADCKLPREAVEAAARRWGSARARVAATLKRCADDVDARLPDARG